MLRLDLQDAKRAESRNRFISLEPRVTDSAAVSCERASGGRACRHDRLLNNEKARRVGGLLWSLSLYYIGFGEMIGQLSAMLIFFG
ncbi:MAG: hypothetical protein WAK33_16665, partial [Silvibacterium sp.]